jgi:hypothetical protein
MLVVQVVELLWDKASRDAGSRDLRAKVPRALPIDVGAGNVMCVIQHYRLHAWRGFQPELERHETLAHVPGSEGSLRIRSTGQDRYLLGFAGNTTRRPPPGWPEVPIALVLEPGAFVRFIVNARHTSYSGQTYVETTFNVTAGVDIPANRFLLGPPDRELDMRGHLF